MFVGFYDSANVSRHCNRQKNTFFVALCVLTLRISRKALIPSPPPSHPFYTPYDNQFVADCLLDPAQEFQLVHPFPTRNPYIPSIAAQSGVMPTLEEVELVPAALVKFKPSEFGPGGYTGLRKDLIIGAQSLDRLGQQHRPGVQR